MSVTGVQDGGWYEVAPRKRLDSSTPVSRLMTTSAEAAALEVEVPRLPSVRAFATVSEAAHIMASRGLSQLQVRDSRGAIVGVLTASDLYRWVAYGETRPEYDAPYDEGHA